MLCEFLNFRLIKMIKFINKICDVCNWSLKWSNFEHNVCKFMCQCSDLRSAEEMQFINKIYVDWSNQEHLSLKKWCFFEHDVWRFLVSVFRSQNDQRKKVHQ